MYKQWNDADQKAFRDWIKSHLKYGPVTITFVKKDGTERTMLCTLKEDQVKYHEKKTERTKEINEEVCPVFDIEKQEWRSFRFDSVKEVRFDI